MITTTCAFIPTTRYATFSRLAGVDPTDNATGVPPIDSLDQWPVISGATTAPIRAEVFPASDVLIHGRWKLINKYPGRHITLNISLGWTGPLFPKVPATPGAIDCRADKPCLFDVVADAGEHFNLAADPAHAALIANMTARLAALQAGLFEGRQPNVTTEAVCAATEKNGGFLTPSDWVPGHPTPYTYPPTPATPHPHPHPHPPHPTHPPTPPPPPTPTFPPTPAAPTPAPPAGCNSTAGTITYNDDDKKHVKVPSAAVCCSMCGNTTDCRAWSWYEYQGLGKCRLTNGTPTAPRPCLDAEHTPCASGVGPLTGQEQRGRGRGQGHW